MAYVQLYVTAQRQQQQVSKFTGPFLIGRAKRDMRMFFIIRASGAAPAGLYLTSDMTL